MAQREQDFARYRFEQEMIQKERERVQPRHEREAAKAERLQLAKMELDKTMALLKALADKNK